jgi:hypothetical protein
MHMRVNELFELGSAPHEGANHTELRLLNQPEKPIRLHQSHIYDESSEIPSKANRFSVLGHGNLAAFLSKPKSKKLRNVHGAGCAGILGTLKPLRRV